MLHRWAVILFLGLWLSLLNGAFAVSKAEVMQELSDEYIQQTLSSLSNNTQCTTESIAVRHEWETLSKEQKLDYIRAVKCLHSKPSLRNTLESRNRAQDFVIAHIDQTLYIHFSALLLPWHRYFLHLYEKALREECGYEGYQPYWDWPKYLENLETATIFDGSEESLGGNGVVIPDRGELNLTVPGGPPPGTFVLRPPGTGGGCIIGPFENISLHINATNQGASTPLSKFETHRCLTRDSYTPILATQNSYQNVTSLILNSPSISEFHTRLEASNGIHPGGHLYIGGENNNFFTSPGDPAFFFHHAMIDRVWAIWQSRDLETRREALDGTLTFMNYPPSRNATVMDILNMGGLAEARNIGDFMETTGGGLCYMYQ